MVQGKKIVTSQGEICLMDSEAEHSVGLCDEQDILINILIPKRYFNHNFFSRMSGQGILSRFLLNAVTKQRNREHFLQFPTSQLTESCMDHGTDFTGILWRRPGTSGSFR